MLLVRQLIAFRHHEMRFLSMAAATLFAAGNAGCTLHAPVPKAYSATIERITERDEAYVYLSPVKGEKPLHCLYLRVKDPARNGREVMLRVLVLDLYSSGVYGRVGDTVSFLYRGDLPEGGDVEFESVVGYKVLARRE